MLTIVDDSNCEIYNVVFEELNKKYNQIKQHSGLYLLYYILDYYVFFPPTVLSVDWQL